MGDPMLERVPLEELAKRKQVIEIQWKVADFERLVEIVDTDLSMLSDSDMPEDWRQTPVDIRLRFGWARSQPGIPMLEGSVSTSVAAVCQRCLGPMMLELAANLNLLLPRSGISVAADEEYEVWEFDSDDVSPADIVEEALVMALPFSALHKSSDDCGTVLESSPVVDSNETVRPFGDLRSLMAESNDNN